MPGNSFESVSEIEEGRGINFRSPIEWSPFSESSISADGNYYYDEKMFKNKPKSTYSNTFSNKINKNTLNKPLDDFDRPRTVLAEVNGLDNRFGKDKNYDYDSIKDSQSTKSYYFKNQNVVGNPTGSLQGNPKKNLNKTCTLKTNLNTESNKTSPFSTYSNVDSDSIRFPNISDAASIISSNLSKSKPLNNLYNTNTNINTNTNYKSIVSVPLPEEADEIYKAIRKLTAQLSEEKTISFNAKSQINSLKNQLSSSEEIIKNLNFEISQEKETVRNLNFQLSQEQAATNESKSKNSLLSSKLEILNSDKVFLNQENIRLRNEIDSLLSEISNLKTQINTLSLSSPNLKHNLHKPTQNYLNSNKRIHKNKNKNKNQSHPEYESEPDLEFESESEPESELETTDDANEEINSESEIFPEDSVSTAPSEKLRKRILRHEKSKNLKNNNINNKNIGKNSQVKPNLRPISSNKNKNDAKIKSSMKKTQNKKIETQEINSDNDLLEKIKNFTEDDVKKIDALFKICMDKKIKHINLVYDSSDDEINTNDPKTEGNNCNHSCFENDNHVSKAQKNLNSIPFKLNLNSICKICTQLKNEEEANNKAKLKEKLFNNSNTNSAKLDDILSSEEINEIGDNTIRPVMSSKKAINEVQKTLEEEYHELLQKLYLWNKKFENIDPQVNKHKRESALRQILDAWNEVNRKANQIYTLHDAQLDPDLKSDTNINENGNENFPPTLHNEDQACSEAPTEPLSNIRGKYSWISPV